MSVLNQSLIPKPQPPFISDLSGVLSDLFANFICLLSLLFFNKNVSSNQNGVKYSDTGLLKFYRYTEEIWP